MLFSFLPKNKNSYRCTDTEIIVFLLLFFYCCYLRVCECFLALTGARWPLSPSTKQGDIGVKAAYVDTVQSIRLHLLIRTHSQTPSSSPTFSGWSRNSPLLRAALYLQYFFFLHQRRSTTWPPPSGLDFNPLNTSNHSPKCPPPRLSALHLLFSCSPGSSPLSPLWFSPRPPLFSPPPPLPAPSGPAWASRSRWKTCQSVRRPPSPGGLKEGRRREREASGEGGVAGAVTQHRILSAPSHMIVCIFSLCCAEGQCDCWGQKLLNLNMPSSSSCFFFQYIYPWRWERQTCTSDLNICIFTDSFFSIFFVTYNLKAVHVAGHVAQ